jgi:hypothetical protein
LPNGVAMPPLFSSFSNFLAFWRFDFEDKLLCIPHKHEFLEGTNFKAETKLAASKHSVYFTSPHHLHALYQLVTSSPDHQLIFVAVDGVFGFTRAGSKGTCIITLSSVFPDIPCAANARVVRRNVPMPKALTTRENGGTVCALLKATAFAFTKFFGFPMSFSFVVLDMGAALKKGVVEHGGLFCNRNVVSFQTFQKQIR